MLWSSIDTTMYIVVFYDSHRLFFFQAEDGIRDSPVTGVQTCALPISGFDNFKKSNFVIHRIPLFCLASLGEFLN